MRKNLLKPYTNLLEITSLVFALLFAHLDQAHSNEGPLAQILLIDSLISKVTQTETPLANRLEALVELYAIHPRSAENAFRQSNLEYIFSNSSVSQSLAPFPTQLGSDQDPRITKILEEFLDPIQDLRRQIEGDVLDFNLEAIAQGIAGPIPALQLAGSFKKNRFLFSTEARVHYTSLIRDISPQSYLHHMAIPIFMLNDLVPLIKKKFSNPAIELFTTVIGDGKMHFASLAVERSGKIGIVDSSVTSYLEAAIDRGLDRIYSVEFLNRRSKSSFTHALNKAQIPSHDGSPIRFQKPKYYPTSQQRDRCNCLIFSLLNTHQMAKRAQIRGYKEVSHAFQNGSLQKYEDLFKIGEDAESRSSAAPTHKIYTLTNWKNYRSFTTSFREKTQELLKEYFYQGVGSNE